MPVYEFKCAGCELRFERLCQIGETGANVNCPHCGRQGPGRVMSGFNSPGSNSMSDGSSSCGSCSSGSCATCGH
ncbi:MAG TPA: zinc ribbon domain-containing protein [Desulfotomaculum sp.]|nr:zinc ribbon domain-containing protein [Desulfotomaculum sp.]